MNEDIFVIVFMLVMIVLYVEQGYQPVILQRDVVMLFLGIIRNKQSD